MTTISTALRPSKNAILVGASSGIGAALARRLAREGYTVALLARRAEALAAVCEQINAEPEGQRARAYPHDATDTGAAPELFQTILRDLGSIDLVVYCAGQQLPVALDEYDFAKDHAMLEANLLGAVAWLNQAAMLFERLGRGQIVGISSIAGERGRVGSPVYNTSKAALNTYLEALRKPAGAPWCECGDGAPRLCADGAAQKQPAHLLGHLARAGRGRHLARHPRPQAGGLHPGALAAGGPGPAACAVRNVPADELLREMFPKLGAVRARACARTAPNFGLICRS